MIPRSTRFLRRGLLVTVVVVTGAVAWSLRRAPPRPAPSPSASGAAAQGTTFGEMEFFRFRESADGIEVRAGKGGRQEGSVWHLEGCEVTLPYVAEGQRSTATIAAAACELQPEPQRARFRGAVRVRTEDGLELETESLEYQDGTATTADALAFRKKTMSGSAKGAVYRRGEERLELGSDVRFRLSDQMGRVTDIAAGRAVLLRRQGRVEMEGGVRVVQGASELVSDQLNVDLDAELSSLTRAVAIEGVILRSVGAPPGTQPVGTTRGPRTLRCRRLELTFWEGGELRLAVARNQAALEVLPGPGEPPERRTVEAHFLAFGFDELGRLIGLEAQKSDRPGEAEGSLAVLTAEALPPSAEGRRQVTCERFSGEFDAASGRLARAGFLGHVVFTEPGRKAFAGRADYVDAEARLTLLEEPRLVDERGGSDLHAQQIVLDLRQKGVVARESVRHTVRAAARRARAGLLADGAETVFLSRLFDYDEATKTARYRESAILRSGRDEIRAPSIELREPSPDKRRLHASGGVASVLHPKRAAGAKTEPAKVEAHSQEMTWEEAESRVVYTGDVIVRQGDIRTRSPQAVVRLSPEGAVETMVAGQPVEVVQGRRQATGDEGTYTPATETLVLTGDKVVLQDADRRVQGRVLTFQVGNDRIRVDGREEVRAEAIFKKREPPKP